MASVPVPLDEASLRAYFLGRPAYRRTRYIVVRAAAPDRPEGTPRPRSSRSEGIGRAAVLGDHQPHADRGAGTDSVRGRPRGRHRRAHQPGPRRGQPGARRAASWSRGRYGHVGFIADPAPIRVRVVEVVPPHPPKLLDQASRVLDLAEDLPPIELVPELTDLGVLARNPPAGHYLFPCRAGTPWPPRAHRLLSRRAPANGPTGRWWDAPGPALSTTGSTGTTRRWWTCARGTWPGRAAAARTRMPVTSPSAACSRTRSPSTAGLVVVPWGASLAQIREGLRLALTAPRTAAAPGAGAPPRPGPAMTTRITDSPFYQHLWGTAEARDDAGRGGPAAGLAGRDRRAGPGPGRDGRDPGRRRPPHRRARAARPARPGLRGRADPADLPLHARPDPRPAGGATRTGARSTSTPAPPSRTSPTPRPPWPCGGSAASCGGTCGGSRSGCWSWPWRTGTP